MYCFWIDCPDAEYKQEAAHQEHVLSFSFRQEEAGPATVILELPLDTVLGQYALIMLESKPGMRIPYFRGYVEQVHQAVGRMKVHLKAFQHHDSWEDMVKTVQAQCASWNLFWDEADTQWKHVLSHTAHVPYWCPVSGVCSLSSLTPNAQDAIPLDENTEVYVVQSAQVPAIGDITLEVHAQWLQHVQGVWDLFPWVAQRFSNHMIATCTPESLRKAWPKPGTLLGQSGYRILHSELEQDEHRSHCVEVKNGAQDPYIVQRSVYDGSLWVFWSFKQKRHEIIHTTWRSGISGEPHTLRWNLGKITNPHVIESWNPIRLYKKGDLVQFSQKIFEATNHHQSSVFQEGQNWRLHSEYTQALARTTQSSFFLTELGKDAFQYALGRVYRIWLQGARCRKVTLKGPLSVLSTLNLKHSICVRHPQWGVFCGKVTNYTLTIEPENSWVTIEIQGLHPDAGQVQLNPNFARPLPPSYAQDYASGWYVDPEHVAGEGPLRYRAYDTFKPQDNFAHVPFLMSKQLIHSIDIKFDDQAQLEYLSEHTFRKTLKVPATHIKVQFRSLKGQAYVEHRIPVEMESHLSVH